ncbi:MAG: hypothetical protein HQL08_15770 [Nitrospirae bacterium]|nr:hypothetical protein [Nitrospirota bacterium]
MDKVVKLCSRNRDLLHKFSRLTLNRLGSLVPLRLPLQIFEKVMDVNVAKEVEKDRLIVEHAAALFYDGKEPGPAYVAAVFEKTKEVDREYIKKLSLPLITIKVRYEDFEEIRKQRISRLSQAVCDVLKAWNEDETFEDAVRSSFGAAQFGETIGAILHLYNLETMKLNRSIAVHPPFHLVLEPITNALYNTMEDAAKETVTGCVREIYGD